MMVSEMNNTVIAALKVNIVIIKYTMNAYTLNCMYLNNYHITLNEEQSKTISKNIALLRRAKSFVPRHVFEKMYNAFIIPHFYYCSTVWYDGSKNELRCLSFKRKRHA